MMQLNTSNQPTQEMSFAEIHSADDAGCGFEITDDFKRFNACNDVFARAQWDPRIRSSKSMSWFYSMLGFGMKIKKADGYTQKDFALRNAGWVMANLMMERTASQNRHDGFLDDYKAYKKPSTDKVAVEDRRQMSAEIKKAGLMFGADMIGITGTDLRWHYTHRFDAQHLAEKPYTLPEGLDNCIVIGTSMQYEIMKTYPSALAGTAVGLGYSKDAFILHSLAQFIRNMGYEAVATLNDTAQAIPYAIKSGLAEYGRNGLAITKDFGPRVRFGKIFTNLPLVHDHPVKLGVKQFCEICTKCADACPAKAISYGDPSAQVYNQSNIIGVKKWTVDGEKCFSSWVNQGTECGICIRVCPYNKGMSTFSERLYFRFFRYLAGSPLRKWALILDTLLQFGARKKPSDWWKIKKM